MFCHGAITMIATSLRGSYGGPPEPWRRRKTTMKSLTRCLVASAFRRKVPGDGRAHRGQVTLLAVLLATMIAACGGDRTPAPPAATATSVEPTRIALAVAGRSNSAASVAAFGQIVAAAWTASTDDSSDIYMSVSTDGGATFGAPVRVNDTEGDARASGEQAGQGGGRGRRRHTRRVAVEARRPHRHSICGLEGPWEDVFAGRHGCWRDPDGRARMALH